MLEEELKNIEKKIDLKKLKKQANNLKIMIIIQFMCLILIAKSIISIIRNYTTSSMSTFDIIISASGFLAILIFFLISKPINKNKVKFKTNYYDIIMLPIIRKVNANWTYLDENNMSEIIREFILSGLDINILIHHITSIDIIGYGQHRKLRKIFDGIFAVVETNIDKNFNLCIEGNNGFVKISSTLNDIKIKSLTETFYKNTLLDFDLVIRNGKIYIRIFSGNKFKEHIFKKINR